ncbi:hypothetical protein [Nocardia sp. NPDC052566]|uniref:hypothetical protein n=1 Tax=Nocardia sp. NPDC052566 TaxID=3364330 RepID=UPI0037C57A70
MKALILAIAAVAAVGGLAGCATENGKTAAPSGTNVSSPATADGSTQDNQGGSPGTTKAKAPQATSTTLPSRDDANVDARDFQQGDKFYFQSPSGNILCGFINADGIGTGCQVIKATVVPDELKGCGTQPNRTVAAEINGGRAKFRCLTQGLFVGQPPHGSTQGGGKVLEYGQTIIVRGTACTSLTSGVRCDSGGHGFLIAADAQSLF